MREVRLIEIGELKEWVEGWFEMDKYYHPYAKSNNIPIPELYDILEKMPTIDPVKRGRWVKLDMHPHLADHKCTACGESAYVPTCMGEPMYLFCPNCGALMREGGEEE